MALIIYEKEIAALRLLDSNFENLTDAEKQGRHHTLMWTINALVECGVVEFTKSEILQGEKNGHN